ncbi:MAG: D-2-hydroxyacid dehydrogenase [Bacteroidia bacterium]|nr:D-2-hydroxyacid dehydrogenase [Bacteroidia bacterium]
MMRILANDGIVDSAKQKLIDNGFDVVTDKVPQEELVDHIGQFDVLLVRSATIVTSDIIDSGTNLKIIGRAGVGVDNIEVDYAESKNIKVVNTPGASAVSVAELVMAHLLSASRFLNNSNRQMPEKGNVDFKELKKKYSKGVELKGKTLGVIGFGRIGQEVTKLAIGIGMDILAYNKYSYVAEIIFEFPNHITNAVLKIPVKGVSNEEVIQNSDFITIHTPFNKGDEPIISKREIDMMKDGVGIINCARGGAVNEKDLLEALNSGKVAFAGLDVFENEPTPNNELLDHPNVSLSPHIGGSTVDCQERIGNELADKVIHYFKELTPVES